MFDCPCDWLLGSELVGSLVGGCGDGENGHDGNRFCGCCPGVLDLS